MSNKNCSNFLTSHEHDRKQGTIMQRIKTDKENKIRATKFFLSFIRLNIDSHALPYGQHTARRKKMDREKSNEIKITDSPFTHIYFIVHIFDIDHVCSERIMIKGKIAPYLHSSTCYNNRRQGRKKWRRWKKFHIHS